MIGIVILLLATSAAVVAKGEKLDAEFSRRGLIDIQRLDSSIAVDLRYATTHNFTGKNMYGTLRKAYFRQEIARMIVRAQRMLKRANKDYSLIIYDAARPLSAQRRMYRLVRHTRWQRYVAYPYNGGGHHNFGLAVDLSFTYKGHPVDMGTGFDSFKSLAHIDNELANLRAGRLSRAAFANRRLLRRVMKSVGFNTERCEWWHFDYYKIKYARRHFRVLDF